MTRRNYHETSHESTRALVNQNPQYIKFNTHFRHQIEVFFSPIMVHRAVPLSFDTHMRNNINMQTIGFKKRNLKEIY